MTDKRQNYEEYMASGEWRSFRERYFASGMPSTCLVCGSTTVTLHHLTYRRFKRERLTDVVPLCWQHHKQLHEAGVRGAGNYVDRFKNQLKVIFGLSRNRINSQLKPWAVNVPGIPRRKLNKQRKKLMRVRRQMAENRAIHEQMCG